MSGPGHFEPGPDDAADTARFDEAGAALVDAVSAVVPDWIERLVTDRIVDWRGSVGPTELESARRAGAVARQEVVTELDRLVRADVDDQSANPLAILRRASERAGRVLEAVGVPAVERDEFARRAFPDDVYDLVPATWADVHPTLVEPGITWSAAKAFLFKARRNREGRK